MKFFIKIVLLIIGIGTIYSQQYWIRIPSPSTKWLRTISFTNTLNGWAAGDSGVIIHTSNAGFNWTIQYSGINYYITHITFINPRLGWGIANDFMYHGTTILKTTNGGVNWSSSNYTDSTILLQTIFWSDSLTGYLGGQDGTILKTTNAGINWGKCLTDSGAYASRTIYKFKFMNQQVGFACGGLFDAGGVFWKTTDSGNYWQSKYACAEPIFDLVFINSQTAIGSGGDYEYGVEVVRTTDNGNSWNFEPLQMFGYGASIAARTSYELWIALGYGSHWERSLDTGNTFTAINIPDTSGIMDVEFIDSLHGWAVGSNSSIYKFNKDVIGINKQGSYLPVEYRLNQNYPNPFNPKTKIMFEISSSATGGVKFETSNVKLIVYDVLGHEVETLVNKTLKSGQYKVEWDGSKYSSGIYFYRLRISGEDDEHGNDLFSLSKKMILLK